MGHYVDNRETGRLELHFSRQEYDGLSAQLKAELKRTCLFAKSITAWVSRTSTGTHWQARDLAKRLGLEDRGEQGEKPAFADRMEAKQDRAAERAGRMDDRAAAASKEASARFDSPNVDAVRQLAGEPIKVGHHSEKRHRRLIEKADDDMRKGVEALAKSKHYDRRAEAAERTASAAQLKNVAFLQRRIEGCHVELRDLARRLLEATAKADHEWVGRLADHVEEQEDRLAFYSERMEEAGGVRHGPGTVKPGHLVLIKRHGWWAVVIRANAKTVTVQFVEGPCQGKTWQGKYPYAEIGGHKPEGQGS